MFGYWSLTALLIFVGHLDEARQLVEESIEYEHSSGMLRTSDLIGWMFFFSGENWEHAITSLRHNIEEMTQANILAPVAVDGVILAHFLLARNEPSEALTYFRLAQPIMERLNENRLFFLMEWGLAKLHTDQSKLSEAGERYERLLKRWKTTRETFFIFPILKDGVTFYAQIGNLVQARAWLAELQMIVTETGNPVGVATLLEAQGIIAGNTNHPRSAIEMLRQAGAAWKKLGWYYYWAQASHRLAEQLLIVAEEKAIGQQARLEAREEAETLLNAVVAVYQALGISASVDAIQQLRAETRLDAQQKRRRTLRTQRSQEGLTPREMRVLSQLAAGQTNKEIASTLSISVGTVELHVTHILTKLDGQTRLQAVTYALTKGWVALPNREESHD